MPTTFNWIYLGVPTNALGNTIYIDIIETADESAENAIALTGQTFGTAGNPLYNNIASATMNGTGTFLNQSTGQTFQTTYGGTTGTLTHDAVASYNITLTYADGTTATTTAVLVQSTTGQLFLAPALGPNALHTAKPIVSLHINSVFTNVGSFTLDRPMVPWDNGWVQGTGGNDTIGPGYVEPVGSGSDVIDGGDGITSVGTGWNDDRIDAGAGNDLVYAGLGNDFAYGGSGNDGLFGGAGNDTLYGEAGDDSLEGGADDDRLFGGTGRDSLYGGAGNDVLEVDAADLIGDSLSGGAGNDTISGGGGADTIFGGDGNDSIDGGAGNDTVDGGIGDDLIRGGTGADSLSGGTGNDYLDGGIGDDVLEGGAGTDSLYGGTGNDSLYGGSGDDTMTGGADRDVFYLEGSSFGTDSIAGSETGDDFDTINTTGVSGNVTVIFSGSEAGSLSATTGGSASFAEIEGIVTGSGNDTINAALNTGNASYITGAGNDSIIGGSGNETIDGGSGNDSINGGAGNDSIFGGAGNDTLDGGSGNDLLNGGDDADTFLITGANFGTDTIVGGEGGTDLDRIDTSNLNGNITVNYTGAEAGSLSSSTGGSAGFSEIEAITTGSGNDTINAGSNTANSSYVLGAGNDSVIGGSGNETIDGGIGDDILFGGGGNDSILGGTGQDLIDGGSGNDTIDGGDGNDVLSGGDGDDSILGGQGNDTIDGGSGADLIYGGDGDDSINGGIGNDTIFAGTGSGESNYIEGGQGNDLLYGSDGTDTLSGGAGADILHGNLGNDSLIGGDGTDSLYGGQGDDTLSGGADNDSLDGGDGNDSLTGGSGADTLTGGSGNDVFIIDTGGDLITDFGAGNTGGIDDGDNTNNDFVDLSAYYNETTLAAWNAANPGNTYGNPLAWMRADQADGILQQVGGLRIQNGGAAVAADQLTADTTGVTCFTRGTLIKTSLGEVAVEHLRVGQHMVLTVDSGYLPISWIGSRVVSAQDLAQYPNLLPIRIRAHALGPDNPVQDLVVSPQHRILVSSRLVRNISGEMTALVAAKHLVGLPGITIASEMERVEYWHFLFDGHEIVWSNGAQTESLYTGKEALKSLSPEARREIFQIFPELERPECVIEPVPARRLLTGREGRELTRRNLRKASSLVEISAMSASAHMV